MYAKVDDWSPGARIVSFGWLLVWVVVGSALLCAGSLAAGLTYLGLWVAQFVCCRYLACTRCFYYGRKCNMLGGDCAKLLFKARPHGAQMPDDAIVGCWWAVVTLFPIPFFAVWGHWLSLGSYLAIAAGWHICHHFVACRRCQNTNCPLNPDKGIRQDEGC